MGVDFMRVCNSVLVDPDLHNSDTDWLGWNPSWYFANDGFHPNTTAHKEWGDGIFDAIVEREDIIIVEK